MAVARGTIAHKLVSSDQAAETMTEGGTGSRPLLQQIYAHCMRPEFVHEFVWRRGSIAFWDNRATWHFAKNDYHGHRREMHRITVEGEPLGA